MTWFRVDDNLYDHPKWIGASLEARALWFHAAVWCSRQLTDGRVPTDALDVLAVGARVPLDLLDDVVRELVARRLWIRNRKGVEFHGWLELQPSRDDVERNRGRWRRTKALYRDRALVEHIKTRDDNRCRYCARHVSWSNRKGEGGAVFDHVDPNLPESAVNDPSNVVVACRACNSRKNDRTPNEAGMTLLPAPHLGTVSRDNHIGPRPVPDLLYGNGSGDGSGRVSAGQVSRDAFGPLTLVAGGDR